MEQCGQTPTSPTPPGQSEQYLIGHRLARGSARTLSSMMLPVAQFGRTGRRSPGRSAAKSRRPAGYGSLRGETGPHRIAVFRPAIAASGAFSLDPITLNPGGNRNDTIAVAHPHIEHPAAPAASRLSFQSVQQPRVGRWPNLRSAETLGGWINSNLDRPIARPWSACHSKCRARVRPPKIPPAELRDP